MLIRLAFTVAQPPKTTMHDINYTHIRFSLTTIPSEDGIEHSARFRGRGHAAARWRGRRRWCPARAGRCWAVRLEGVRLRGCGVPVQCERLRSWRGCGCSTGGGKTVEERSRYPVEASRCCLRGHRAREDEGREEHGGLLGSPCSSEYLSSGRRQAVTFGVRQCPNPPGRRRQGKRCRETGNSGTLGYRQHCSNCPIAAHYRLFSCRPSSALKRGGALRLSLRTGCGRGRGGERRGSRRVPSGGGGVQWPGEAGWLSESASQAARRESARLR